MKWSKPGFPSLQKRHRVSLLSARLWLRHMLFWGGAVVVGLAATAFALGSDYAHTLFQRACGFALVAFVDHALDPRWRGSADTALL